MWYHDAQPIHIDNKLGYKMHLIKSSVQRPNNDAAVKYELNDLVQQTSFDDTFQRQNSVSFYANFIISFSTNFVHFFENFCH